MLTRIKIEADGWDEAELHTQLENAALAVALSMHQSNAEEIAELKQQGAFEETEAPPAIVHKLVEAKRELDRETESYALRYSGRCTVAYDWS